MSHEFEDSFSRILRARERKDRTYVSDRDREVLKINVKMQRPPMGGNEASGRLSHGGKSGTGARSKLTRGLRARKAGFIR